jgi:hypothetical protein
MRLPTFDNFMTWFCFALVAFFLFGPTVTVVIIHWLAKHNKCSKIPQGGKAVIIDTETFLYMTGFISLGIAGYIYFKYSFAWYASVPLCFFVWFLLTAGIKFTESLLVYIVEKWL